MKRESVSQAALLHLRILVVLVLLFAGPLLALLALGFYPGATASAQAPTQNQSPSASPLQPVAGEHISWSEDVIPETKTSPKYEQSLAENLAPIDVAPPRLVMAPTRSSFMANWESVSGAMGYRLDVSASASFNSFVSGYENLDVGNITSRIVSGLSPGTNYYYRVRAYNVLGTSNTSEVMTATTLATMTGLVITPTFDISITGNLKSAAIQSVINQAIAKYQSLFKDAITVSILFRYSNKAPNGTLLGSGVSRSDFPIYFIAWSTFINALKADAKTANDTAATASLPASALSTNIAVSSANGRAVGQITPPGMFANGTVAIGGPYDGIVTLNSGISYAFTRPPSSSSYDAQRQVQHETDEVLGLGSRLNLGGSNLRPQDLFSWSSAGQRNLTSSGTRYFSINSGTTNIVNFNQNSSAFDFGDWLSSTSCPQAHPYVQNAFGCPGQYSDVTASSPEGINLDVIGYDLVIPAAPTAKAATNVTTNSFKANWSSVTGATSYRLDVSTSSTFSSYLSGYQNIDLGNVTSRSVSGLSAGTTYYYRVRAHNSAGTSSSLNVISVTTVPAVPTASAATNVTTSSFTAHWSSVKGATSYKLDVSTSNTFSSYLIGYQNIDVGNVTSRSVIGLSAGRTCYYRVRAHDSGGTSVNSNVVSVTTL